MADFVNLAKNLGIGSVQRGRFTDVGASVDEIVRAVEASGFSTAITVEEGFLTKKAFTPNAAYLRDENGIVVVAYSSSGVFSGPKPTSYKDGGRWAYQDF